MTEEKKGTAKEPEQMSIEETFEALEETIKKLEDGSGSLEEAFGSFEEGMKLVRSLNSQIEKVEKQILILSEGEGNE
ncbi:MAG TPA: exodeoxyribonuclease VII small subunit [Candidatus Enterocloster faecavium]|uniref:Exodeoxyribonuclease 7 small subunit n=1 Tax=Candidatus Enterocloster faecavium TaxID=2838560 RepID=A0A9D2RLE7_9FIRM|nr:exodeoxyribonuclease VII small subunit [Candidatus Enterocloster faecavium]